VWSEGGLGHGRVVFRGSDEEFLDRFGGLELLALTQLFGPPPASWLAISRSFQDRIQGCGGRLFSSRTPAALRFPNSTAELLGAAPTALLSSSGTPEQAWSTQEQAGHPWIAAGCGFPIYLCDLETTVPAISSRPVPRTPISRGTWGGGGRSFHAERLPKIISSSSGNFKTSATCRIVMVHSATPVAAHGEHRERRESQASSQARLAPGTRRVRCRRRYHRRSGRLVSRHTRADPVDAVPSYADRSDRDRGGRGGRHQRLSTRRNQ
jgi:hypothetical protein